ncbi:MAG: lipocalin family protein [Aquabacterium sp.]
MNSAFTRAFAPAARHACLTLALGIVPLLSAHAAASTPAEPLQPVASVDLTRYMGHWYQIAFYPNAFQKQCVGNVTADYKLLPYGQVEVINRCGKADGTTDQATGRARLQQPRLLDIPLSKPYSTARLEVRFAPSLLSWLPLVWAPYWVIQLADDYRYAVVSEPTRQYLWILSRTPTISPDTYEAIKARLVTQGFDVDKLVAQPQTGPSTGAP